MGNIQGSVDNIVKVALAAPAAATFTKANIAEAKNKEAEAALTKQKIEKETFSANTQKLAEPEVTKSMNDIRTGIEQDADDWDAKRNGTGYKAKTRLQKTEYREIAKERLASAQANIRQNRMDLFAQRDAITGKISPEIQELYNKDLSRIIDQTRRDIASSIYKNPEVKNFRNKKGGAK